MKYIRNIILGVAVLLLILSVGGVWFVRRAWPQVNGTIHIDGIAATVRVIRDTWGVPHIYAQNEHDLFMAQGYVHAQDRLWQMESRRRAGDGTLSAIVGKAALESDLFMRTLGMRRAAERQWNAMPSDARTILEDYAAGVNAYITTHRSSLPLEFTALGFQPSPWTPVDSLTYSNLISYSLGGNYRLELLRARLIARLGEARAKELLLPYGEDMPLIIPPGVEGYAGLDHAGTGAFNALDSILGDPGPVWGSNNWVVHGSRTATGKPLLANDTHLGLSTPSSWYENGLHGGRFNTVGFTFPGVPAVVIGHNQRIAWGQSNLNPDVEDLYIEKLNDKANPTHYEFEGQWHDLQIIKEMVEVKGQAPQQLTIRLTRHGPIVNEPLSDLMRDAEPMALRWTGVEEHSLFASVVQMNLAANWQEFRKALSLWDAPGQNFVYADVDGNIGYQATGKIPIRPTRDQGVVPVPGWTGTYEWQSYIPFDRLPTAFNPPAGFVATANNKIVSDDYPYTLSPEWDPGFRARRITDLLVADDTVTMEDMQHIQADTYSLPAEALRPHLLKVEPEDERQASALAYVKGWDLRYETDRIGASVYQAWYWFLARNLLNDELGEDLATDYLSGQYGRHGTFQVPTVVETMADPSSPWIDDHRTPQVETREDISRRSLADALKWLDEKYGPDPAQWTWGQLHTVTFVDAPIGRVNVGLVQRIVNYGPMPVRGDNFTVDASSFDLGVPFTMIHGTSQRDVIDLSDLDSSVAIHTTGQSGLLFHPHRNDFILKWQNVEYHPMLFSQGSVEANAEATLALAPR